jgi:hypothetical protein
MIRPHCLPLVMAALLSACASSPPVAEVRLVARTFDDLNAASAPLLDDLALAERAQGQANAETRAKKRSGATAGAPAAGTDGDPCPQVTEATGAGGASIQKGFCLEDSYYYSELTDPPATAVFRRGLAAIGSYTEVLLILAEGRNIPAATAQLQGLAGDVGSTLELAGAGGVGASLNALSAALQPVLTLAAGRANAKELARNVKSVSPQALAVVDQLRKSAPELFNTLTEQSVRGFGLASEEAARGDRRVSGCGRQLCRSARPVWSAARTTRGGLRHGQRFVDARRARGAFRSIERTGRCVASDIRGAAPGHTMKRR